MFEWWNIQTTLAIVVLFGVLRWIGQPIWDRHVGWHLRVCIHVWVIPTLAAAGMATAVTALAFHQIRLAEVLLVSFLSAAFLLHFLIGAKCPDCSARLKCSRGRYGPIKYRCRQCAFSWIGWPLKDVPPD